MPQGNPVEPQSTRAIFTESFLVNDDQRGCYLKTPLKPTDAEFLLTPYSIPDVDGIAIPLPRHVYIKAEIAETIAWDLIKHFARDWSQLRKNCLCNASYVDQFVASVENDGVIARTYLTHGWKYKLRIHNNCMVEVAKALIIGQDLPRYVWVTEFGTFDGLNEVDPLARRIMSHVVVDATSSQHLSSGPLILHVPGFVWTWSHDEQDECGPYKVRSWALPEDGPYMPRIRGQSSKRFCC